MSAPVPDSSSAPTDAPAPAAPGLPDYLLDSDAVLKDTATWRNGRAPDYKRMRADYEEGKSVDHKPGMFPFFVNNLVKNWEIEASYKTDPKEWRTIDPELYKFKSNDGPWLTVQDMLRLGTYNALIGESEFYSSERSNFVDSHKTFKRAIRSFTWEVTEVFSELPVVAFSWRHFGLFHGKFTSFTKDGSKVEAEPSHEMLSVTGMAVARLTPELRIASIEVHSDPAELFRQMTKNGVRKVGEASPAEIAKETEHGAGVQAASGGACPMGFGGA